MKREFESLQDWFDRIAERFSAETALQIGSRKVTYSQVRQQSDRLAQSLVSAGARPGSIIAILSEDTAQIVASILATLKAGCAFMPLDLEYPEQRLRSMLAQTPADWFLVDSQQLGRLEELAGESQAEAICLDGSLTPPGLKRVRLHEAAPQGQATRPDVASGPDDLAYIVFTSGSTGQPKPIAGRLKGIDHYVRWEIEELQVGPGSRVSQLASPSFDAFLKDAFVPLCAGGTICVPEQGKDLILDSRRLLKWVDGQRLDVLHMVPSLFRTLLREDLKPELFASLRHVLLAGEVVHLSDVRRWREVFGERIQLLNMYGPSETTILKLCHKVTAADLERRSIPIGKPIRGSRALLLDQSLRVCAPGTVGEIYIRTPFRALGYYKRPDLTSQVFLQNPFNDNPQDLIYKTGDFGRVLDDGSFEFLGRKDHQVKVRGVRIELGEIESLLLSHEAVKEAAVVDREDAMGNRFLCAFVVSGKDDIEGELRHYLGNVLPDSLIPSPIIALERLPRTLTGKVDRKALPSPQEILAARQLESQAPRTPVEEILAELWKQLLGLKAVGIHQDFFALSGHSLLATQLVSRIRSSLDVELPLEDFFENPTIAGLAECVQELTLAGEGVKTPPLKPLPRSPQPPLSFSQQRLWLVDQLQPGNSAYHIKNAIAIQGQLDITALQASLGQLLDRHEALRTTFPTAEGRPFQSVSAVAEPRLPVIDLSRLDSAGRQGQYRRIAEIESQAAFDLARDPMLRATLLHLSAEDHVLLLTIHHIVCDDWSIEILIEEWTALYRASSTGRPAELAPLPIQYADFALWQRSWLDAQGVRSLLDFWKKELEGVPQLLSLPTDRPRPSVITHSGASRNFWLDEQLTDGLRVLGRQVGLTPFMTLLSAFQILLWRYSGQDLFALSTSIAGRNRVELEGLIGFFVNTLVLKSDLSGSHGLRQQMQRVRRTVLSAFAHQDLPFTRLVDELQPERSLDHTPFFQIVFTLHNVPQKEKRNLPGLSFRFLPVETRMVHTDLVLDMVGREGGMSGRLSYNTALFDGTTIQRMVRNFVNLLREMVADPERRPADLPLLDPAEQRQMLAEWNDTQAGSLEPAFAPSLFEAQVQQTPDNVAVECAQSSLSYRQLQRQADRLARRLARIPVQPEALAAVCLPRSADLLAGMLAILKSGGAYLPLDPSFPASRLECILKDSQAAVLLSRHDLLPKLPLNGVPALLLDEGGDEDASGPPATGRAAALADNLAYVIFTSGSTGAPKGVQVSHRGLANYLQWCRQAYLKGPGEGVPVHTSIGFDLTVTSLLAPLAVGERAVILPEGDAQAVIDLLGRPNAFSMLKLTPSHLRLLAGSRIEPQQGVVVVGGEELTGQDLAAFAEASPDTRIVNEYGPTEATVGCSVESLAAGQAGSSAISIGRPIANARMYIVGKGFDLLPMGASGEICIGGPGVARGYLKRPHLTARAFVPDPFSQLPGSRLYRTGDVGRLGQDGRMIYLGRRDHQVKLRGFRVELGEIEAVLGQHPSVRKAVVTCRREASGHARLAAYLTKRRILSQKSGSGSDLDAEAVREFLVERLPDFMIPSDFVVLKSLPMALSGKVDRKALPAPGDALQAKRELVAPRTPSEARLTEIWKEVLGHDRVGVEDNFFGLGGDSILAIQIISRARQAGMGLSVSQFFQHPRIAELARMASGAPIMAEQGRIEGEAPLTPAQAWFFEQAQPEMHHWNQTALLEGEAGRQAQGIRQAVWRLADHHDALRMRFFRDQAGHWRQRNSAREGASIFCQVDLSALGERLLPTAVQSSAAQVQASLNLESGPLLRFAYYSLGADRPAYLQAAVHHLVVDGVSWRILLEDLRTACQQSANGRPVALPPKTTAFKHWAERLSSFARSPVVKKAAEYWLAQPEGQIAPLPVDFPAGANLYASARTVSLSLSQEETQALLREIPGKEGSQIQEVLLAALARSLIQWAGGNAVALELEGHGREALFEDLDVSRTVGWFTSLFPVFLPADADSDWLECARAVRERLRSIPDRGVGYGLLRYLSDDPALAERLRALPQPEVSFNYLGQFEAAAKTTLPFRVLRQSVGLPRSPRATRPCLLEVSGIVSQGQLRIDWVYSQNLHRRSSIEEQAGNFMQAVRTLVAQLCAALPEQAAQPEALPQETRPSLADGQMPAIEKMPRRGRIPLSFNQERMWRTHRQEPGRLNAHVVSHIGLSGPLDAAALRRSIDEIFRRHETLRTVFRLDSAEQPFQRILPPRQVACPSVDLQALPQEAALEQARNWLSRRLRSPFDLAQGPLVHLALFRLGEGEHLFILVAHHIVCDQLSAGIFIRELAALYQAFSNGLPSPLPELGIQCADFAVAQRRWLQGERLQRQLGYWRRQLQGARPVELPLDHVRTHSATAPMGSCSLAAPKELGEALRDLSVRASSTLFMVILAAWKAALRQWSGQDDISVLSPLGQRRLPELEPLIGFFPSSVILRTRFSGQDTFFDLVQQVRDTVLQAFDHPDLPFETLMREGLEVDSPADLMRVTCDLYNSSAPSEGLGGIRTKRYRLSAQQTTSSDLQLVARNSPAGLGLSLHYRRDLFEEETIALWLEQYKAFLQEAAQAPQDHHARLWGRRSAEASGGELNRRLAVVESPQ